MPRLAHVALVVRDYDEAIAWFTARLGFTLIADEYQPEQDKRWVLIAPPGSAQGSASILVARASTPEQEAFIGNQAGGRVFLFLATDDFDRDHAAFAAKGVRFVREPAVQPYGKVAVFEDLYGNLWDLVEFAEAGWAAAQNSTLGPNFIASRSHKIASRLRPFSITPTPSLLPDGLRLLELRLRGLIAKVPAVTWKLKG